MRSVPDYNESCTSVLTEEIRLMGDFFPSLPGIVATPAADSRATARVKAVDVMSRCRARLLYPSTPCLGLVCCA